MNEHHQAFLDFYTGCLYIAEDLIQKAACKNHESDVSKKDSPVPAQDVHHGLSLVDCEMRKAYNDFCDFSLIDPPVAVVKFKEFLSSTIIWQKALEIYIKTFDLQCDQHMEGSVAYHVEQQLKRRSQRMNQCSGSNPEYKALIESSLTWDDVHSMLTKSNGFYWSPYELSKKIINMMIHQKASPGNPEAQISDANINDLGYQRDEMLNNEIMNPKIARPLKRLMDDYSCDSQHHFVTAADRFSTLNSTVGDRNKNTMLSVGHTEDSHDTSTAHYDQKSKSRRTTSRPFVSPLMSNEHGGSEPTQKDKLILKDPLLEKLDEVMVSTIMSEILDNATQITWDDIAGLEHAKGIIKETVIWPMLRPDIFSGIRAPPKGILLFGPPGTGKTLIGKFIASQCKATFFSISSSSLTSKWIGDGEKMVRTLFAVARVLQPSVIFIDEVDSLLAQRSDSEVEATRRIKTEFLVQFDGCSTKNDDRVLLIGATNRPEEIDEAARRRFRKKLYIPLPEAHARALIITNLLSQQNHILTEEEIQNLVSLTEGYSGYDVDGLVREAALGPVREIGDICSIDASELRPIQKLDFIEALTQIKASVSDRDLGMYIKFNEKYGSVSR